MSEENNAATICQMVQYLDRICYTMDDCHDYGSTSCPLTMHKNEIGSNTKEDLEEVFQSQWS